jgi:hypothetical protein
MAGHPYFDTDVPEAVIRSLQIAESTVARAIVISGMFPAQATMIDRVPRASQSQLDRAWHRLEAYRR